MAETPTDRKVNNEIFDLRLGSKLTIPYGSSTRRVDIPGSLIYDNISANPRVYYSDGTDWRTVAGSLEPVPDVTLEPVGPEGTVVYNEADNSLYYSDGASWIVVQSGPVNTPINVRVGLSLNLPAQTDGTLINWDLIEHDPAGIYDAGTNLFTLPEDGLYEISASIQTSFYSAAPLTFCGLGMKINSAVIGPFLSLHAVFAPGDFNTAVLQKQLSLSAGDTIDFFLEISGVGTTTVIRGGVNATTGAATSSWVSIRRIEQ